MKDCGYVTSAPQCCPEPPKTEEEQYPEFSLWGPESVKAVFGTTKLEAGATYDLPARVRIKSVSMDEKKGTSDVRVCIVAVGKIKKVGSAGAEEEYEEEDEEES